MAEQAGGGVGDAAPGSGGRCEGKPRLVWWGAPAAGSQPATGRRRGSARGYYGPPPGAGSTLVVGSFAGLRRALEWADRSPAARELTHDLRLARPDCR